MTGFSNPFKEVPKALFKKLKEKITGRAKCIHCERAREIKYLEKDYLGRWECYGESIDSHQSRECRKIAIENIKKRLE